MGTTCIYALSLHDALPIFAAIGGLVTLGLDDSEVTALAAATLAAIGAIYLGFAIADGRTSAIAIQAASMTAFVIVDRKSTRLNSSHSQISYAVFCLKKKTG